MKRENRKERNSMSREEKRRVRETEQENKRNTLCKAKAGERAGREEPRSREPPAMVRAKDTKGFNVGSLQWCTEKGRIRDL